jgi:hypothetical protein
VKSTMATVVPPAARVRQAPGWWIVQSGVFDGIRFLVGLINKGLPLVTTSTARADAGKLTEKLPLSSVVVVAMALPVAKTNPSIA